MILDIYNPGTFKEAQDLTLEFLKENKSFYFLAGGTDLFLKVNKEKNDFYLINLKKIEELKSVKSIKDHVFVGALNTFSELQKMKELFKFKGLLDCINSLGAVQIRNTATIGGNIINAAAAADMVTVLMAINASLLFAGINSERILSINDYFKYYKENKIRSYEILKEIILPDSKGASGFYKLSKRNALAIARASAAVYLEIEDSYVLDFRLALGALGEVPYRVFEVENEVIGKSINYLYDEKICMLLKEVIHKKLKGRKTADFKSEASVGVYKKALNIAVIRLGGSYE